MSSESYDMKRIYQMCLTGPVCSWIPDVKDSSQAKEEHHEGGLTWTEIVEDTPIYQLLKLLIQQLFGFHAYLLLNVSGQPRYKGWVNHYDRTFITFILRNQAAYTNM